jgi:ATP-dependent exoDNAse (exonuclease V) alpha subunit
LEKLLSLQQPIARFDAVNSDATAKAATQEVSGLPSSLVFSVGASVMITSNLWQKAGIFNGLTGRVYDIIYEPMSKPPDLPLAVIVQANEYYTGPSLLANVPRLIAITPLQLSFMYRSKLRWRQHLPLMLSWARTIHKSQGMTLDSAVVDLGASENAAGLTFVALSRVKTLSDLLLIPFSEERFKKIGKNVNLSKRMQEERRLQTLELTTRHKYSQLFLDSDQLMH